VWPNDQAGQPFSCGEKTYRQHQILFSPMVTWIHGDQEGYVIIRQVLQDVSPTLVAVLVKGGAHHLDLRASNPKDPATVTQAREQELELIQKFIQ